MSKKRLVAFVISFTLGMSCLTANGQGRTDLDGESNVTQSALPVGEVSMLIGRAFLSNESEREALLNRGDFLYEGNIIRTSSSGHVHIRFRDEAVMSVRPSSELHIVTYRFDENHPENSIVKFDLVQGTARAVSGGAAESARDRFRLNTPIAAIGVRGTDFVVSATQNSIMAVVNDGAIVVSPFSAQCAAQGIGPCEQNGVELESGSMQILEFDTTMNAPQLVPVLASGQEAQQISEIFSGVVARNETFGDGYQQDLEIAPQPEDEASASVKEVVAESVTSLDLGANASRQAPYQTGYTPADQVDTQTLRNRQLVWGRFANGKDNLERLTLPMSEAAQGRNITVGGNFEYFLFRPEVGEVRVKANLGKVGFSLMSAQAYFKEGKKVTPVAVSGGNLMIDFNENVFQTSLDLYHMQLGEARLNSAGRIYDGGYFHFRDGDSRIVGAVSLDGRESGYFFDFFNWNGLLQGITLWDAGN